MRRGRTNSTFRSDEMIEFSPNLGEDALIGRAPVRPRGRSSSSSTNNHSISSKQQRSSSITKFARSEHHNLGRSNKYNSSR